MVSIATVIHAYTSSAGTLCVCDINFIILNFCVADTGHPCTCGIKGQNYKQISWKCLFSLLQEGSYISRYCFYLHVMIKFNWTSAHAHETGNWTWICTRILAGIWRQGLAWSSVITSDWKIRLGKWVVSPFPVATLTRKTPLTSPSTVCFFCRHRLYHESC